MSAQNPSSPGNAAPWASLFDLDPSPERLWTPEELGAILRHQLSAAVEFDLAAVDPTAAQSLSQLCAAEQLLVHSFSDVLFHAQPPIELLVMLKNYAKANAQLSDSALPADVARVLYYLAIAAALTRHRRRISQVGDEDLALSMQWAADLPWIDPTGKQLLRDAIEQIKPGKDG